MNSPPFFMKKSEPTSEFGFTLTLCESAVVRRHLLSPGAFLEKRKKEFTVIPYRGEQRSMLIDNQELSEGLL